MTLKDPDSPVGAQPCETHCYLVPTGEMGQPHMEDRSELSAGVGTPTWEHFGE